MEQTNVDKSSEYTPLGEFHKSTTCHISGAKTKKSSQKQLHDKDQRCQLCQKQYKWPRMLLQCFHVFCTSCLVANTTRNSDASRIIQCHICSEITTLPTGDVLGLPVDMVLSAMVDKVGDFDEMLCTCSLRKKEVHVPCNPRDGCDMYMFVSRHSAGEPSTSWRIFSWHSVSM